MNHRFRPRASQKDKAKKRRKDKQALSLFRVPDDPYRVMYWRKTKPSEKTNIFYISFSVENDPKLIVELISKQFDGFIHKMFNWQYWYEIQLTEELFWGEIVEWVDLAFKDLFK